MDELSIYQKLDMIEALVRFNGGKFKYLSNQIPAYCMPAQKWVKIDMSDPSSHLSAQKDIGKSFLDTPSERALLGGISRYKDKAKMISTIRDVITSSSARTMHPSVAGSQLAKVLEGSGFVFHSYQPLHEVVTALLEKDMSETGFIASSLLSGAGYEGFWPEHHGRHRPQRFDPALYQVQDGISYLEDPRLVRKAITSVYMDNPHCEIEFLTRIQGMLCHSNLGMSIHHEKASAEKPSQDVIILLRDAFRNSSGGSRGWVLDRALEHLKFQYDGLEINRKVDPQEGLRRLREILAKNPSVSHTEEASPSDKVKESIARKGFILKQIAAQQKVEFLKQIKDRIGDVAPASIAAIAKAISETKIPVGDLTGQSKQLLEQGRVDEAIDRVQPYVLPLLNELRADYYAFLKENYPGSPCLEWFDEAMKAHPLTDAASLRNAYLKTTNIISSFSPVKLSSCEKDIREGVSLVDVRNKKELNVSDFELPRNQNLTVRVQLDDNADQLTRPRI